MDRMLGFEPSGVGSIPAGPAIGDHHSYITYIRESSRSCSYPK